VLAKRGHLLPAQYFDFGTLKGMGKQKLSFFTFAMEKSQVPAYIQYQSAV